MSRILRARLWLGAAGVGAVVFAVSLAAMVRSCEMARLHAAAGTFASLIEKDADYWRQHGPGKR